jgi:prophage regulatory protein
MSNQLHRLGKVKEITGLSRSTIYLMIQSGGFPKPVKISARCVAWPQTQIDSWIQSRIDSSASR